jgi:hypothetical protein
MNAASRHIGAVTMKARAHARAFPQLLCVGERTDDVGEVRVGIGQGIVQAKEEIAFRRSDAPFARGMSHNHPHYVVASSCSKKLIEQGFPKGVRGQPGRHDPMHPAVADEKRAELRDTMTGWACLQFWEERRLVLLMPKLEEPDEPELLKSLGDRYLPSILGVASQADNRDAATILQILDEEIDGLADTQAAEPHQEGHPEDRIADIAYVASEDGGSQEEVDLMQTVLGLPRAVLPPEAGLLHAGPSANIEWVLFCEIEFDKEIANLARCPPEFQEARGPDAARGLFFADSRFVFGTSTIAFPVAFRQIPDLFQCEDDIFPLDVGKERIPKGPHPDPLCALGLRTAGPAPAFSESGIEPSGSGPVAQRPCIDEELEGRLEADLQFPVEDGA